LRLWRARGGESAGSGCGGVKDGKVGKWKPEAQQGKSVTEGKVGGKRVTFRLSGRKEEEEKLEEIKEELKVELRKRFKVIEERLEKEVGELRVEMRACKEYVEGLKFVERSWERKWEEMKEKWKDFEKEVEKCLEKRFKKYERREEEEEREDSEIRSERKVFSSREGSGYESSGTVWSEDRLSSKEMESIRK